MTFSEHSLKLIKMIEIPSFRKSIKQARCSDHTKKNLNKVIINNLPIPKKTNALFLDQKIIK